MYTEFYNINNSLRNKKRFMKTGDILTDQQALLYNFFFYTTGFMWWSKNSNLFCWCSTIWHFRWWWWWCRWWIVFVEWLTNEKHLYLFSSQTKRFPPSQTSGMLQAEFEPVQNLSSNFAEESCAVVITTITRHQKILITSYEYNLPKLVAFLNSEVKYLSCLSLTLPFDLQFWKIYYLSPWDPAKSLH